MVLGKNLSILYSTMEDLSALSMKSTLGIIQESLNAIYSAGATLPAKTHATPVKC